MDIPLAIDAAYGTRGLIVQCGHFISQVSYEVTGYAALGNCHNLQNSNTDILHNDAQHNCMQHNNTQHNDDILRNKIQHISIFLNGLQHNDIMRDATKHIGILHNVTQHFAIQQMQMSNSILHNNTEQNDYILPNETY